MAGADDTNKNIMVRKKPNNSNNSNNITGPIGISKAR